MPQNLYELGSHRCSVYRHPATGAVLPWRVNVGGAPTELHVAPSFCTNDEDLELEAVLSGQVIAQLAAPPAAKLIRSGELVPVLVDHMADHASLFIYYGSRSALPARTRAFIDFVAAPECCQGCFCVRLLRWPVSRACTHVKPRCLRRTLLKNSLSLFEHLDD